AGTFLARTLLARVSATAFQPEFGAHLDQALGVYVDLARALKREMRAEADALAAGPIRAAAAARDRAAIQAEIERAFAAHPSLVELRVESCGGEVYAERRRERPFDPATERSLPVDRALSAAGGEPGGCLDDRPDEPFTLRATFAAPRQRLDELEG